jgi:DUF4097 and DUF4098 domain-containing protein YvlB
MSLCLCALLVVGGCIVQIGNCFRAKYEKVVRLQSPLESGSTIAAETSFGSITAKGADVTDCNVVATICVQAPSEDEAAEIAEKVNIRLDLDGKTLTVKADKPRLKKNRSIGISYQMTVPTQVNLECSSSYGSIKLADTTGYVKAHTSYGSIDCDRISGQIRADTSYGRIDCRDIASEDLTVDSSYGDIHIDYSDAQQPGARANVGTSYGDIDFAVPHGFAGQVETETGFGSIETDVPITAKGEISKKRIQGTLGQGDGKLALKTSFGSVKIR